MTKAKKPKTDDEDTNPTRERPDVVNAADFGAGADKSSAENIRAIRKAFATIPDGGTVSIPAMTTVVSMVCIVCGSQAVPGDPCPVDGYTN